AGALAPLARSPAHAQALPQRRGGRVLLREELSGAPPALGEDGADLERPEPARDAVLPGTGWRHPDLGGEPRGPGDARAAASRAQWRRPWRRNGRSSWSRT